MGAESIAGTETPVTPTEPETVNDANTGTNTGEETPTALPISQKALDGMLSDRAAQAKRNAVSDLLASLGVSDVTALKSMAESHTVAETKRLADEDAAKSELQKKDELLQASVVTQTKALNDGIYWQTVAAIQRLAPGKSIPAERFNDLLTLMDKSTIQAKDGVIDDTDVEAAIDKTLEGRDYLKVEAAEPEKPNRQGSPTRKPSIFGKNGKTETPERREKKSSI